jgi:hypothetical protein
VGAGAGARRRRPGVRTGTVATGAHGELATLVVTVALSATALRGIVVWISKNRRFGSFTREVEIIELGSIRCRMASRLARASDAATISTPRVSQSSGACRDGFLC